MLIYLFFINLFISLHKSASGLCNWTELHFVIESIYINRDKYVGKERDKTE
jgi:hypothetical protein